MKKLALLITMTALLTTRTQAAINIVNAASFMRDTTFTPGTIISVFGTNIAGTTAFATDAAHLPRSLGGVTLTIGGVPSILFYVSPGQVNAMIDPSVALGSQTAVLMSPTGTFSTTVTIATAARAGIFTFSQTGTDRGAILNAVTFDQGPFNVTTNGQPTFLAIYATGVGSLSTPDVRIGGFDAPVVFFGAAPGFAGLQQINVQVPASLAGAGNVEVVVNVSGLLSNTAEISILPNASTPAAFDLLSSVATVPNTSLALTGSESLASGQPPGNGTGRVSVVDLAQGKVTQTIGLTGPARPAAIAVNAAGTVALVAERQRNAVLVIDLTATPFRTTGEVAVGPGPVDVTIVQNLAYVVSQHADSVTVLSLAGATATVMTTVAVGRGPRGVAADEMTGSAYVTNEDDGTISVISLATQQVTNTILLTPDERLHKIRVLETLGLALIAEPSNGAEGRVVSLNLATQAWNVASVNPDRTGGAADIAATAAVVAFANQTGGTVVIAPYNAASGGVVLFDAVRVLVDAGDRALAVDAKDGILVVLSAGTDNLVLIDLTTNRVTGRIGVT